MSPRGRMASRKVLVVLVLVSACGGRTSSPAHEVTSGASSAGAIASAVSGSTSGASSGMSSAVASGASAGVASGAQGMSGIGVSVADDANADGGPESGIATVAPIEAGPEPPSCAPGGPGLTSCGPGGTGTESCCTSLEVTGGTFYRTYDYDGFGPEDGGPSIAADGGPVAEADSATISSFHLDKYLVTVGRFRQFVSAWNAGWTPAMGSGKHTHLNSGQGLANASGGYETGWVTADIANIALTTANMECGTPDSTVFFYTWTSAASTQENFPINCVNWYEAYAFCIWDGGFLPSEAEWEYSAAGGDQQREYPWGSTGPGSGNQYAIYGDGVGDCYYPSDVPCVGISNIAPVGTPAAGAGRWGQLDMAGEMDEWNVDWYSPYVDPCIDCGFLTLGSSSFRVLRGGMYDDFAGHLVPPYRDYDDPTSHQTRIGFRCARNP
jgi:formylglycine-generating enzyme required for sulfatase activity